MLSRAGRALRRTRAETWARTYARNPARGLSNDATIELSSKAIKGMEAWQAMARTASEMEALGAWFLRSQLRAGDVILLESEVGGGKSVFARGAIRSALSNEALAVPSPTFLLELIYGPAMEPKACAGALLRHYDLYRLPEITVEDEEAFEWDVALLRRDICFIEWPEAVRPILARIRKQTPSEAASGRVWKVQIAEADIVDEEEERARGYLTEYRAFVQSQEHIENDGSRINGDGDGDGDDDDDDDDDDADRCFAGESESASRLVTISIDGK